MSFKQIFSSIANQVAHAAGTPSTFIVCCTVIVVWAATGPLLGFSDTWQLIINTGTTIVTFLMVFLIQNTQIATVPPSRPSLTNLSVPARRKIASSASSI